jgi:hypothetical protein
MPKVNRWEPQISQISRIILKRWFNQCNLWFKFGGNYYEK